MTVGGLGLFSLLFLLVSALFSWQIGCHVHQTTINLLVITSIGSKDMASYIKNMKTFQSTTVKFAINCYDTVEVCERLPVYYHENKLEHLIFLSKRYKGAKTFFWKKEFSPEIVAAFDYIWFLDADLEFGLNSFPLTNYLAIANSMNASIFQPSMKNDSRNYFLPNDGIDVTCRVEVMTPFFSKNMWAIFYDKMLSKMNDKVVHKSSWGPDEFWCSLAIKYRERNGIGNSPCLIISKYPIMHLDTKSFKKNRNTRVSTVAKWHQLAEKLQISSGRAEFMNNSCYDNIPDIRHQLGPKETDAIVKHNRISIHSSEQPDNRTSTIESDSWKVRAADIYDLHRQQNISTVLELSKKWNNFTIFPFIKPFELFLKLKDVYDLSDNELQLTSQYVHALQIFQAMKRDNITDTNLLFLGLMHDIGKVLTLKPIAMPQHYVMCSTFPVSQPMSGLCYPPNSDTLDPIDISKRLVTSWNHDEFGYQKLKSYVPENIAWVIRHHSLSALLKGELSCQFTPKERKYNKLLRQLWHYDHRSKSRTDLSYLNINLQEVQKTIEIYLPKYITF